MTSTRHGGHSRNTSLSLNRMAQPAPQRQQSQQSQQQPQQQQQLPVTGPSGSLDVDKLCGRLVSFAGLPTGEFTFLRDGTSVTRADIKTLFDATMNPSVTSLTVMLRNVDFGPDRPDGRSPLFDVFR